MQGDARQGKADGVGRGGGGDGGVVVVGGRAGGASVNYFGVFESLLPRTPPMPLPCSETRRLGTLHHIGASLAPALACS